MSDVSLLDPVEPIFQGARSLVREGLMQTNLDAGGFQILNLDTSNLALSASPNDTPQVIHNWFDSYDGPSHSFGISQPSFSDLAGILNAQQMEAINTVGIVGRGEWKASVILGAYLANLGEIRPPLIPVSFNQQRLTNCANAVGDQDAVNLRYVNAILPGLKYKEAVQVASVGNLALGNLYTVDGYALQEGDRILVKDQIGARNVENGIYNAHAGIWTRSEDADTGDELVNAITYVKNGTVNSGVTWWQSANPVVIGTTPIIWLYFNAQIGATAGVGLGQSGNTIFAVGTTNRISIATGIDISSSYVGQHSITTLGTITDGTWNGEVIDSQYGGTGMDNEGYTILLAGDVTTALALGNLFNSPLTINLHGPTTLTVPVAGTVATLAGAEDFTNKTWAGKSISLVGNFSTVGISGPATLQFTLGGNTNVTLPNAGTLATIAGNETFTNKHISGSQIDSGSVSISHGGTGATTVLAAINNLLPDQTGNAGKTLHTDGTNVFWS